MLLDHTPALVEASTCAGYSAPASRVPTLLLSTTINHAALKGVTPKMRTLLQTPHQAVRMCTVQQSSRLHGALGLRNTMLSYSSQIRDST
jgi:hypothetical protein